MEEKMKSLNLKRAICLLSVFSVICFIGSVASAADQKITADQVENALIKDGAFQQVVNEFVQSLFRAQVRKMPELLKGIVGLPFTKRNYLEARLLFWENGLKSGFVDQMADATPTHITQKSYKSMVKRGYSAEVSTLKILIKDIGEDAPLDKKASFDSSLLEVSVGLNEANLLKYHKGELTVGDVLMTQPLVLITRHVASPNVSPGIY